MDGKAKVTALTASRTPDVAEMLASLATPLPTAGSEAVAQDSWDVLDYETWMLCETCRLFLSRTALPTNTPDAQGNAILESLLLHCRVLCEIAGDEDEVKLSRFQLGLEVELAAHPVARVYGQKGSPNTVRWKLNKRMAHATAKRGHTFDYGPALHAILPVLEALVRAIESSRASNRFPRRHTGPLDVGAIEALRARL